MPTSVVRLCAVMVLAGTAACSDAASAPGGCSPESLRPAIIVQIAVTSGPVIRDTLARGIVRDGDYSDSLRLIRIGAGGLTSLGAAINRPGTYDITVVHPGYEPWEKDSVLVDGAPCGIKESRTVVAQLEPLP